MGCWKEGEFEDGEMVEWELWWRRRDRCEGCIYDWLWEVLVWDFGWQGVNGRVRICCGTCKRY